MIILKIFVYSFLASTFFFDLNIFLLNITSVYITTGGAKGTEATLKMQMGDIVYGERSLSETNKTFMFKPGGASGQVSFKFHQAKSVAVAIYVKEIKVYYSSGVTATYDLYNYNASNEPVLLDVNSNISPITKAEILFNKYSNNNWF